MVSWFNVDGSYGRLFPDKFRGWHAVRLSIAISSPNLQRSAVGGRICGSLASQLQVVMG